MPLFRYRESAKIEQFVGFNGTFEKLFFCWVLMGHLKKYFSADFRLCVWITSPSEWLTETTQKVTLLSTIWRQLSTINLPKSPKPKYNQAFPDDTFRTKCPFWNSSPPNLEAGRNFYCFIFSSKRLIIELNNSFLLYSSEVIIL